MLAATSRHNCTLPCPSPIGANTKDPADDPDQRKREPLNGIAHVRALVQHWRGQPCGNGVRVCRRLHCHEHERQHGIWKASGERVDVQMSHDSSVGCRRDCTSRARLHCDEVAGDTDGIGLAPAREVHGHRVGRIDPTSVHENGSVGSRKAKGRDDIRAGRALSRARGQRELVCKVVSAVGSRATERCRCRVSNDVTHGSRCSAQPRGQHGVQRPPLGEAIQLPKAKPDAAGADQRREDEEAERPSAHSVLVENVFTPGKLRRITDLCWPVT